MSVVVQPEKIKVPVQCHDGEEDKMEGLADPKVIALSTHPASVQYKCHDPYIQFSSCCLHSSSFIHAPIAHLCSNVLSGDAAHHSTACMLCLCPRSLHSICSPVKHDKCPASAMSNVSQHACFAFADQAPRSCICLQMGSEICWEGFTMSRLCVHCTV